MRILSAIPLIPLLVVPQAVGKVAAGQPFPEFQFQAVLGGDGRTKLSEFRGQPVLISWYSTVFAGVEGARIAADLEQEHGAQGLAVFLMEIKNHDATYVRALQMAELPGARCRLIRQHELPVAYDDSLGFPPKMVLIGVDGTLLYAGSYQRASDLKKLLEAELVKVEKGWGADAQARKARALAFGAGKLGEARALLEPAASAGAAGAELATLAGDLEARFESLVRSVAYHLEQGEPRRAAQAMAALELAAQGREAWVARSKEVAATLATPEVAREGELEERLDVLLKSTLKSKPKKGLDERLRAFAAGDATGTKVGARAARLAQAVARLLEGL
jgi:hypothetical protein